MPCIEAPAIQKPALPPGFSLDPPTPPSVAQAVANAEGLLPCCKAPAFADVPFATPRPALPAGVVAAIDAVFAVLDVYLDALDEQIPCPKV